MKTVIILILSSASFLNSNYYFHTTRNNCNVNENIQVIILPFSDTSIYSYELLSYNLDTIISKKNDSLFDKSRLVSFLRQPIFGDIDFMP